MDRSDPVVSIYCLTYNHENYIRDCLESLVNQKTDFPFEVIVHDDASTDHTADIIREYEQRYPEIIRPVYQRENQYSKKINIVRTYIYPRIRGKYVAICEGDDYWTDDRKLQDQVTLLEEHPDCRCCVGGVQEVTLNKVPLGVYHPSFPINRDVIPQQEFIEYVSVYAFQTSSYLLYADDWKEYMQNPPAFREASDIGDTPLLLFFGSLGNAGYIDRVMSCYRRGAPASYSAEKRSWSEEKRIRHYESLTNTWRLYDEYSQFRFHKTCGYRVARYMLGSCVLRGKASEMLRRENRQYFKMLPAKRKVFILAASVFPGKMKTVFLSMTQNGERTEISSWKK